MDGMLALVVLGLPILVALSVSGRRAHIGMLMMGTIAMYAGIVMAAMVPLIGMIPGTLIFCLGAFMSVIGGALAQLARALKRSELQ